jgi:hypothetical protein
MTAQHQQQQAAHELIMSAGQGLTEPSNVAQIIFVVRGDCLEKAKTVEIAQGLHKLHESHENAAFRASVTSSDPTSSSL